jgi:hypothetical protein
MVLDIVWRTFDGAMDPLSLVACSSCVTTGGFFVNAFCMGRSAVYIWRLPGEHVVSLQLSFPFGKAYRILVSLAISAILRPLISCCRRFSRLRRSPAFNAVLTSVGSLLRRDEVWNFENRSTISWRGARFSLQLRMQVQIVSGIGKSPSCNDDCCSNKSATTWKSPLSLSRRLTTRSSSCGASLTLRMKVLIVFVNVSNCMAIDATAIPLAATSIVTV